MVHAVAVLRELKPASAPVPLRRKALPSPTQNARPRTLTPQFHWNLNDTAVQCLSDETRSSLYQLFRFYESSCTGDTLPAIHYARFLELLRDAQLLTTDDTGDQTLAPSTVERVFAHAVLGKLRTYLDADEEPALTFQLFCGALFHCAMLKYPDVLPPDDAFRKLVEILLSTPSHGLSGVSSRGLVQHAEGAMMPSWSVQDLDSHRKQDPARAGNAFLHRQVFQQVLAGLCHDAVIDDERHAHLDELYQLPDELTTYFSADMIWYMTEQYRTFDVFDKGFLPRDEVFALLSGMAKKLEITDVYEVLAVILAGELGDRKQLPRGSLVLTAPSSVTKVSLAQVIQAIYICRRARTASYQQHSSSPNRKVGGVTTAQIRQGDASAGSEATTSGDATGKRGASHGKKGTDKRSTRGKPTANATQPHKSASPAKPASKAQAAPLHPNAATPAKRPSGASSKKEKKAGDAVLLRKLSQMSATPSSESSAAHNTPENDDDARSVNADGTLRHDSLCSASSSASSGKNLANGQEYALPRVATATRETWSQRTPDNTDDREELPVGSPVVILPAQAPTLRLRMFLETDRRHPSRTHDGAICLTIELFLTPPPSRIVTSQGVYFASNGDRDEVWATETTTVNEKLPLEAAIATLRKLVNDKERIGFVLVPERQQREAINTLLCRIRDANCPRYAAALRSPQKKAKTLPPATELKPTSLDRGATRVRQQSSLTQLVMVSDPSMQKHLETLKRQVVHPSTAHKARASAAADAEASPTRSCCDQPRTLAYDQVLHTLGLDQPQDAWITTLNDPNLHTSSSLPMLPRPKPMALAQHGRTTN